MKLKITIFYITYLFATQTQYSAGIRGSLADIRIAEYRSQGQNMRLHLFILFNSNLLCNYSAI